MSAAKSKGTSFETAVAGYLSTATGAEIVRRALTGKNDRGDLHGLRSAFGDRIVAELKNHNRLNLSGWIDEAETERGNDDARIAVVIHKRRGRGAARMGEQYVSMTLADFTRLIHPGGSDD